MSYEERGFRHLCGAIEAPASPKSWVVGLGAALLGTVVVMYHGTRSGFSRFRRDKPLFLSPTPGAAGQYADVSMGVMAQMRGTKHRYDPRLITVAVDPGRTMDLSKEEDERKFREIISEYGDWLKREGRPNAEEATFENLVDPGTGLLGAGKPAVDYPRAGELAPFIARRGYDSTFVSEGSYNSLMIFKPGERARILGSKRR